MNRSFLASNAYAIRASLFANATAAMLTPRRMASRLAQRDKASFRRLAKRMIERAPWINSHRK
jgi:hypothetical protein